MQISGNVFLVTGGASGLGEATVRLLVEQGARVVIVDISRARGEALAHELGSATRFMETNVADEAGGRAAVALAQSAFGGLQGLVNAAGIVHGEKIIAKEGTHAMASFRRMLEVNLVGTFNMVCAAAELMSKSSPGPSGERGVIVNTASVAAYDGQIGQAAYAASKGGVTSMTLPLARDLASSGIRVMTIAPGIFETPLLVSTLTPFIPPARSAMASSWLQPQVVQPGLPKTLKDEIGRMVPFPPRLGRPAEFAALARHIIENEMLNGEVIRLDGAIRMQPK
ncbi:MAG: SDR family NAD(P)-dependent oxidoreductase [Pseudomonadota bacterium]